MKVLILQLSTASDVVLTTPLVRLIKIQLDAEVHILVNQENQGLLSNNPYIDEVYTHKSWSNSFRILKGQKFNSTIDLNRSSGTLLISFFISGKVYSLKQQRIKHWLLSTFKLNLLSTSHLVDRQIKLVSSLGINMDNLGVDYFIPEKDIVENSWLPESHQAGYAALIIHSDFATKKLPVKRLIELCDRINKPVVLIGKEEDREVSRQVEDFFRPGTAEEEKEIESLNKKTAIFNACGKFNVNQMASLIEKANWVFSYDSEFMHIAAAFKKSIFSIWGNTLPEYGKYPFRTQFTIFENKKINCRPCSRKGHTKCPKRHFKCMNDLTFDFYLPD